VPQPIEPPVWTADLPGTGGAIGPTPEDFVVDEIPLYRPSGTGEHLYVRIRKRMSTTKDLVQAVAHASGVHPREVGTAGMKDKHAVTTQWVSLPARGAKPPESWALRDAFEVVEVSRHGNKLRTGHSSGNRFRIRLVDVSTDAVGAARAIASRIAERGIPNYFGAQRFGARADNVDVALEWALSPGPGRLSHFERKLFPSVLQAEVFNRYVLGRLNEDLEAPLAGEVVRLDGSKAVFVVDDPASEIERWRTRDIVPTGPIFGPKMKPARGRPLELERAALTDLGLGDDALARIGRLADGTRRDVFVRPTEMDVAPDGPGRIVVSFVLPSGSYATLFVRELTRGSFYGDSR
jgi:tRNA pseudouridine13 synthase